MSDPGRTSVRAFGSLAVLATTKSDQLRDARRFMVAGLRSLDLACSRFRDDSELVALNRSAGRPVRVSETLFAVLDAALRTAAMTEGLVDPTVGRSLRLAGYDISFERLQHRHLGAWSPAFEPAERFAEIELDSESRTARVPSGVELDLGASAKAFAADRIAQAVAARHEAGVLVSIGGDVAVAGPPPQGGWAVLVVGDHTAALDTPGQVVAIQAGGLACSATSVRRWASPVGELHHIIDPRSGRPAPACWATAHVAAATCLEANAAATAAIVLGDEAPGWLAERGLPARLVAPDGAIVVAGRWPTAAAA